MKSLEQQLAAIKKQNDELQAERKANIEKWQRMAKEAEALTEFIASGLRLCPLPPHKL